MAEENAKISVVLVDDHSVLRQGLARLIEIEEDLIISGQAADVSGALAVLGKVPCQLAIVDISLPDRDGIELVKEIRTRFPEIRVLVLSMHDESVYAERALRAGAVGYIMKAEAADELMTAIRKVLKGDIYVSSTIATSLVTRVARGQTPAERFNVDVLSDRELQIFRFIGNGLGNREIATKLFISVKTVEAHREHIKQKLGLESASELLQFAIQHTKKPN